jgi:hypothetical protein
MEKECGENKLAVLKQFGTVDIEIPVHIVRYTV